MSLDLNTRFPRVFYYFEKLSAIPHGSGNTKAISDYCMDFAKELGLEAEQDEANNVIIRKAASCGREADPAVMLQGHLDMVAVAEDGYEFDFEKDGLKLMVQGDFLTAEGTTLGADNGIAVAMCMAILEDNTLSHPALECVFTVDEEIGMLGAEALDMSKIKARRMINLDCDEEGFVTVSCAGGVRASITVPAEKDAVAGKALHVKITGLQGGHSGQEIHKGLTNGNRLAAEVCALLVKEGAAGICSMAGGAADNAIPAQAQAVLHVYEGKEELAQKLLAQFDAERCQEIRSREPGLMLQWDMASDSTEASVWKDSSLAQWLLILPDGVQAMSKELENLVETSLNLGIMSTCEAGLKLEFALRSSVQEAKEAMCAVLTAKTKEVGGTIEFAGNYPGWPYRTNSPMQEAASKVWQELFGEPLKIVAIHAGLECGLFDSGIPGLDILAMGPNMYDIHSPRERLSISSTEKMYYYITELLGSLK